ncbi:MAG: hypothetical protein IIV97_04860 [Oscillospiraceae bacterium]|nr:hypothetical protein [Oscillospiraceae bacterium]
MSIISKIFGTKSEREIKKILPLVDKTEALSEEYASLSDEALSKKTDEFKSRLNSGETLDDILPEAFATVREAAKRVLVNGIVQITVGVIGIFLSVGSQGYKNFYTLIISEYEAGTDVLACLRDQGQICGDARLLCIVFCQEQACPAGFILTAVSSLFCLAYIPLPQTMIFQCRFRSQSLCLVVGLSNAGTGKTCLDSGVVT